jgi:prepilin-type N-terminal cleavage/methylation domain-containing protein
MRHARASNGLKSFSFGFSLLEVAIVLVIAGIILGIGTSAWLTMNEARRITLTTNRMRAARDCLINRVIVGKTYSQYTPGGDYSNETTFEVDRCLSQRVDGWGQPILFLGGVWDDAGTPTRLSGECIISDSTLPIDHPCFDEAVRPIEGDTSGTSSVRDKDGSWIEDVAFLLISYGADRQADPTNSGYDGLFDIPNDQFANTLNPTDPNRPNFEVEAGNESVEDDIVMIVTVQDLLAAIARSEQ